MYPCWRLTLSETAHSRQKEPPLSHAHAEESYYSPEQRDRLRLIHSRIIEARRELDALIGDAYLRPRASIVPVHFLDLASAVEKLRWAEKEWRELEREQRMVEVHSLAFDQPVESSAR
ncbi:MAG: hypothetical protein ACR2I4_06485 [Actinomycetota bacterium]|nr:hypothetical protein [Actinomycetota bacterium]MDQ3216945.1 hypothetical protein [Actinomycetota bacterium]